MLSSKALRCSFLLVSSLVQLLQLEGSGFGCFAHFVTKSLGALSVNVIFFHNIWRFVLYLAVGVFSLRFGVLNLGTFFFLSIYQLQVCFLFKKFAYLGISFNFQGYVFVSHIELPRS